MNRLGKLLITGPALALAALLFAAPAAQAAFTNVNVLSINEAGGGGYWDNTSSDVSQSNVGYFLTGTGAYDPLTGNPTNMPGTGNPYKGATFAGGPITNLLFESSAAVQAGFSLGVSGGSAVSTLLLEVAGNNGSNELWFKSGNTYTMIVDGGTGAITTSAVNYGASPFELVLIDRSDVNNVKAYLSNGTSFENVTLGSVASVAGNTVTTASLGTSTGLKQNFALFRNGDAPAAMYIGVEDLLQGDNDYNDMVVKLTVSGEEGEIDVVPAPAGLVLALVGIVPCVALRRRLSGTKA